MGYFSNGAEGDDYEAQYCAQCQHYADGCAVLEAHMLYNYQECNNEDSILHLLIPRSKDGLENSLCRMFIGRP